MKNLKHLYDCDSGQVFVEVAAFMPILVLLLLAAIDFSRFSQFDEMLVSSARAGAQYGSMTLITATDFAGMKTAATNDAATGVGITATAASNFCKCADGTTCSNNICLTSHRLIYVSVTTSGTFVPLFSYVVKVGASPETSTAIMQVEQ